MLKINFFSEDTDYVPENQDKLSSWIDSVATKEGKIIDSVSYIFCSDKYLHRINLEYLNHDTFTDIITFPYGSGDTIEGDIFISIDRIKENAMKYKVFFKEELLRVMSHGILHMCGYTDKSEKEKSVMRNKENEALSLWSES